MSLIECSECGQDVSDEAQNCPHCGVPIAPTILEEIGHGAKSFFLMLLVIAILGAILLGIVFVAIAGVNGKLF